jgi:NADPH:quinone reductase-like Zn-dependent oxidoreductase
MKAIQYSRFDGREVIGLVELPDPHPAPGQIRSGGAGRWHSPIE